jgi:hypothetical protein
MESRDKEGFPQLRISSAAHAFCDLTAPTNKVDIKVSPLPPLSLQDTLGEETQTMYSSMVVFILCSSQTACWSWIQEQMRTAYQEFSTPEVHHQ